MPVWKIESRFVRAEIQSLGAMVGPAWFNIGNTEVQPFAVAPWADDPGIEYNRLPRILQRLRGEWVCVPYGIERPPDELPQDWRPRDSPSVQIAPEPHGRSSNTDWQLGSLTANQIDLVLPYPSPHPVKELRRTVRASPIRPQLQMRLEIEMRAPAVLPIGLHPTFRLPTRPRRALLELGPNARAWTSPVPLEAHIARFLSDARGVPLDRIPSITATEDLTRLPLPYAAEEIVLTTGHAGRAMLTNLDEGYSSTLTWDPTIFPACQLWLSNRGRESYPWNGRFLALGIEPICAAFDFGVNASRNRSNPLWCAGIACGTSLIPSRPLATEYEISVIAT